MLINVHTTCACDARLTHKGRYHCTRRYSHLRGLFSHLGLFQKKRSPPATRSDFLLRRLLFSLLNAEKRYQTHISGKYRCEYRSLWCLCIVSLSSLLFFVEWPDFHRLPSAAMMAIRTVSNNFECRFGSAMVITSKSLITQNHTIHDGTTQM